MTRLKLRMSRAREFLEAILIRHTRSPRFRKASLELLDSHLSRRYVAECVSFSCNRCGAWPQDCIRWSENDVMVDTWGYMEFETENVCARCLQQNYLDAILMPERV